MWSVHEKCGYPLHLPQEQTVLVNEINSSWAILGDKTYVKAQNNTLDERRILIPKNPTPRFAQEQAAHNLARIRVPIKQFFGRLQQKWVVFHYCFR